MSEKQWYFSKSGRQQGPASTPLIRQMLADGRIQPTDLVWAEGMSQWTAAQFAPGLATSAPPPVPPQAVMGLQYSSPEQVLGGIGQDPGVRWLLPVGRSGWAIAAGYLGLFSFIIFPAPIALIVSILAIRDIKSHPQRHGMGRAIFGLVMGILGSLVFLFFVVVMILSVKK